MSSSSVRRAGIGHFPALDGLRGLALAGVLAFHANGALEGGYLGVDLFFVLSGFLITALLLAEHDETGRVALGAFWVRRARRLFPALIALMPAIAIYARLFATTAQRSEIRGDALATLAYVANWRTIFAHRSYWDLFSAPSPLEHTWSLSIEEQFYLVWPLVVVAMLRRGRRRVLLGVTAVLAALSMAAMALLFQPGSTSRAYLGTDARAAGILAGAALAMVITPGQRLSAAATRRLDLFGAASALVVALAWWKLEGTSAFLYRGGFWLTEAAALVLIACATLGRDGLVARVLACGPLTRLGTLSYGAYLWHWPLDLVLTPERVRLPTLAVHALQLAVTFAIAGLSYVLIERPIRTRGVPFGRPVLVVAAAVLLSLVVLVRATPAAPPEAPPAAKLAVVAAGAAPEIRFRVLLVGDSTANSLGWTIRGLRAAGVAAELHGQDGFNLLTDGPEKVQWSRIVEDVRPDATVVVTSGAFLYGLTADGAWREACHPVWNRAFEAAFAKRLTDLVASPRPVWAATVPYPLGPYDKATYRREVDCLNRSIRKVVASVQGILVLDLAEIVCPNGVCERHCEGATIRPDGVHYDIDGGRCVAHQALAQLRL